MVVVALVAIIALATLASSCGTVQQSDVGFPVGGGWVDPDKNKVSGDLMDPGRHVMGVADTIWTFPAYRTLRFLDFEQRVTTADGKGAVLRGQVAFRFVGEKDPALARQFAEGIGSRKYRGCDDEGNNCETQRAGEGDHGWTGMLNQLGLPEVRAAIKEEFGRANCADFEPACRAIDPREDVPVSNPEAVYLAASRSLQVKWDRKFGFDYPDAEADQHRGGSGYLRDVRIRISDIQLPDEVQKNIDAVTSEQAKTKAAAQSTLTATQEATAIGTRGKALRENPEAISIEVAKVCKGACTIIVDASGKGVTTSVPAGGR